MRTIPYSYVLADAVELWSGESSANSYDATIFNRRIRKRATEFWEMFYWPEWTPVEYRQFRQTYSAAAAYNPGDQVFWPIQRAYYQCLAACTGVPPTNAESGNWALNGGNWALCQGDYSHAQIFDPLASYTDGAQMRWMNTQFCYQCIQATTPGIDPGTPGYWGVLIPFLRNIDFTQSWEADMIAEVKRVYDWDPWIYNNAEEQPFIVTNKGIVVRGRCEVMWMEFRLQAPRWAGQVWSATANYAAGQQVYFGSGDSWDFYVCGSAGATAGQSPATNAPLWAIIPFPYVFRECAAQAAYADVLKVDGQQEKAAGELTEATRLLRLEYDKLERQQGQTRPLKVCNRQNANAAW